MSGKSNIHSLISQFEGSNDTKVSPMARPIKSNKGLVFNPAPRVSKYIENTVDNDRMMFTERCNPSEFLRKTKDENKWVGSLEQQLKDKRKGLKKETKPAKTKKDQGGVASLKDLFESNSISKGEDYNGSILNTEAKDFGVNKTDGNKVRFKQTGKSLNEVGRTTENESTHESDEAVRPPNMNAAEEDKQLYQVAETNDLPVNELSEDEKLRQLNGSDNLGNKEPRISKDTKEQVESSAKTNGIVEDNQFEHLNLIKEDGVGFATDKANKEALPKKDKIPSSVIQAKSTDSFLVLNGARPKDDDGAGKEEPSLDNNHPTPFEEIGNLYTFMIKKTDATKRIKEEEDASQEDLKQIDAGQIDEEDDEDDEDGKFHLADELSGFEIVFPLKNHDSITEKALDMTPSGLTYIESPSQRLTRGLGIVETALPKQGLVQTLSNRQSMVEKPTGKIVSHNGPSGEQYTEDNTRLAGEQGLRPKRAKIGSEEDLTLELNEWLIFSGFGGGLGLSLGIDKGEKFDAKSGESTNKSRSPLQGSKIGDGTLNIIEEEEINLEDISTPLTNKFENMTLHPRYSMNNTPADNSSEDNIFDGVHTDDFTPNTFMSDDCKFSGGGILPVQLRYSTTPSLIQDGVLEDDAEKKRNNRRAVTLGSPVRLERTSTIDDVFKREDEDKHRRMFLLETTKGKLVKAQKSPTKKVLTRLEDTIGEEAEEGSARQTDGGKRRNWLSLNLVSKIGRGHKETQELHSNTSCDSSITSEYGQNRGYSLRKRLSSEIRRHSSLNFDEKFRRKKSPRRYTPDMVGLPRVTSMTLFGHAYIPNRPAPPPSPSAASISSQRSSLCDTRSIKGLSSPASIETKTNFSPIASSTPIRESIAEIDEQNELDADLDLDLHLIDQYQNMPQFLPNTLDSNFSVHSNSSHTIPSSPQQESLHSFTKNPQLLDVDISKMSEQDPSFILMFEDYLSKNFKEI